MKINRGDVYWVNFSPSTGSELRDLHPALVIQDTKINSTNINTVVVVGITSNTKLALIKGNVTIDAKLIPLNKDSVINVSQIFTIDKKRLSKYIGTLPESILKEVYGGIDLLFGNY